MHFSFAFGVDNIVIKKEHYCPLVFGGGKGRIESIEIAFHIILTLEKLYSYYRHKSKV